MQVYILYPEAVNLAGSAAVHDLVPNWVSLERVLAVRVLVDERRLLIKTHRVMHHVGTLMPAWAADQVWLASERTDADSTHSGDTLPDLCHELAQPVWGKRSPVKALLT